MEVKEQVHDLVLQSFGISFLNMHERVEEAKNIFKRLHDIEYELDTQAITITNLREQVDRSKNVQASADEAWKKALEYQILFFKAEDALEKGTKVIDDQAVEDAAARIRLLITKFLDKIIEEFSAKLWAFEPGAMHITRTEASNILYDLLEKYK